MSWVKIDDAMAQHPKLARVGPLGLALQVAGLCYANRNLTDGFIPWAAARTLLPWEFLEEPDDEGRERRMGISISCGMVGEDVTSDYVIGLLVQAGLWEQAPGGYQIHDYADFQPSKAQVLAERAQKQAAGQAGGIASAIARAQAKPQQNSSGRSTISQAKSKPVPVPVPVPDTVPFTEQETLTPDKEGLSFGAAAKPSRKQIDDDFIEELTNLFPRLNVGRERQKYDNYNAYRGRRPKDHRAAFKNWLMGAEDKLPPESRTEDGTTLAEMEMHNLGEVIVG